MLCLMLAAMMMMTTGFTNNALPDGWHQVTIVGNRSNLITGINEIHSVEKGNVSFVDSPKYYDKALSSEATIILIKA